MKEFQVNCVTLSSQHRGHEYISHVGNSVGNWRLSRDAVIRRIEQKPQEEAFFVAVPGTQQRAYIGVVRPSSGPPYLRTYADGKWTDNLLAQPQCGSECKVVA